MNSMVTSRPLPSRGAGQGASRGAGLHGGTPIPTCRIGAMLAMPAIQQVYGVSSKLLEH